MYLRAALTLSSGGDKPALYIGSMVLNYSVGLLLYNSYCVNVVLIRSKFQPPSRTSKRINYGVSFFHLFGSFGVLVCGTVLMFHPTPDNPPAAGLKCLQVILVFVIVVTLVIVFSFAYRFKALRKHMSTHGVLSTIIVMFLVILWASFMLARLCVDLNNPARSSEALFFLLNYVPLILGILATLMLGEPVSGKINYDEGSQLNELQTRKEYDNQNTLQHPKIQKPSDNVQPVNGGTKRPFDA
ncbi:hypothetical protein GGI25_003123 [Coemansia spiralis]|uniref:Uncharacterized protein n=1 Tax=Coemansia spiralis TaxID=417178 RepID=A0A9W8G958_9FUNG|nr:hypothetical protein GGI25_003123 [Coemansia spiralis]